MLPFDTFCFIVIYIAKDYGMKNNFLYLSLGVMAGILSVYVFSHVKYEYVNYVRTEENTWVPYAFYDEPIGEDLSDEDTSEATKFFFNIFIKDGSYCYAAYAPHGAIWESSCFKTEKECNKNLKENNFRTLNTKKCYKPYLTKGWCLDAVKLGINRYYDDGTYGEMISDVCTKTKEQCEQLLKYKKFNDNRGCRNVVVASHHSFETNYLWPEKEIKNLMEQNAKSKPLEFKKKFKIIWR